MVTKPGLSNPAGITPRPGLVYPYGQITQRLVGWTYLGCFAVRIPGLVAGESFDGTRSAQNEKETDSCCDTIFSDSDPALRDAAGNRLGARRGRGRLRKQQRRRGGEASG